MKPHRYLERLESADFALATGTLTRMTAEFLEGDGPATSVGDYCEIETPGDASAVIAEVVSVEPGRVRLLPLSVLPRLTLGARIAKASRTEDLPVGNGFAGRAIDGIARPLDGAGTIWPDRFVSRSGTLLRMFDRVSPRQRLATGIRAIDTLLPLGVGQRVGIFAASGVGKTTLVEQMATQTRCDRTVLCLVGERGREVDKLWSALRRDGALHNVTLVAATADESPSIRIRAIEQAIALAEYWRDRGEHVLLMVDSITRVAQALRELGLASGLPPTVRGLTPNVFSVLPCLVERCGASRAGGAISAVFSVLSETDDVDDPIVELMKSVLDGHIVLSRSLAERGHFPAIDIARSVSRLASELLDERELDLARRAHANVAIFEDARPMIESGLYRAGASVEIDRACALQPSLTAFMRQKPTTFTPVAEATGQLAALLGDDAL